MKKLVSVHISHVEYVGKSIGDDIRIEIESLGEPFYKDFKLKTGKSKYFNKELFRQVYDQDTLKIPLTIRVIERDVLYHDVGTKEIVLNVNLSRNGAQTKKIQIKVYEKRKKATKRETTFEVSFEVKVVEVIRYIEEMDDGWMQVLMDDGITKQSLPAFLKVQWNETKSKRDYFTIMEGWLRGKKRSVKLKSDGSSYLLEGTPYTDPVKMTYSISKRMLKVNGKSYSAEDFPSDPWVKGVYHVSIPGAPHDTDYPAMKDRVWFLINYDKNDRFIHIGRHSLGCITLLDHDRWDNELYPILIRARAGDALHIGTVEIIN